MILQPTSRQPMLNVFALYAVLKRSECGRGRYERRCVRSSGVMLRMLFGSGLPSQFTLSAPVVAAQGSRKVRFLERKSSARRLECKVTLCPVVTCHAREKRNGGSSDGGEVVRTHHQSAYPPRSRSVLRFLSYTGVSGNARGRKSGE